MKKKETKIRDAVFATATLAMFFCLVWLSAILAGNV